MRDEREREERGTWKLGEQGQFGEVCAPGSQDFFSPSLFPGAVRIAQRRIIHKRDNEVKGDTKLWGFTMKNEKNHSRKK